MKKELIILFVMVLSLGGFVSANPIPNWPRFYDGFEARELDVALNDGDGGPLKSCAGHWSSTATHIVRDDLTPRYGTKYLHIQNVWSEPEKCPEGWGYGNLGFMRGYV